MPDFTPCDYHFLEWWRLLTTADPDDMSAYAQRALHMGLSMAIQRKLGNIPGNE